MRAKGQLSPARGHQTRWVPSVLRAAAPVVSLITRIHRERYVGILLLKSLAFIAYIRWSTDRNVEFYVVACSLCISGKHLTDKPQRRRGSQNNASIHLALALDWAAALLHQKTTQVMNSYSVVKCPC